MLGAAADLLVGLTLLPGIALLFLFGWALAVLAGFANVYFEDTQHLCEIGFQILFYATPIIYPEKLLSGRGLGWVLEVNPVVPFLRLLRDTIVTGKPPTLLMYAQALVPVTLLVGAAVYTLSRCQRRPVLASSGQRFSQKHKAKRQIVGRSFVSRFCQALPDQVSCVINSAQLYKRSATQNFRFDNKREPLLGNKSLSDLQPLEHLLGLAITKIHRD